MAPGGSPNKDLRGISNHIAALLDYQQEMRELVSLMGVMGVMRIKLHATVLTPRQPPMAAIGEAKARQSSRIREENCGSR